ncbi:MAG: sodium:calcium antiporter [Nanoarchaeota archaeon]|nr:sodium:calcium antiporter [Nanoarchaeota archaeon]MBU1643866.1 sodium:calcium antiporter [Nanoarchaeota archaeon]MBU1977458.1 sodium:calcium antiporter [Nanoarchaeota archaeon]
MLLILIITLMIFSVLILWKSSGWMTDSLIPVSKKLGTSYIAVTTIIVSLILSLPEIFSSVYAYFLGYLDIGLGVIIGSVMANIGLILGLSAMIKPLTVERAVVIRDGIFMIAAAGIVLLFGSDLHYSRSEGLVLFLLFIPHVINVWAFEKGRSTKSQKKKVKRVQKGLSLINMPKLKLKPSFLTFSIGAITLIGGSYLFSYSLVELGKTVPLPGILIGLIFGGIGTAMPNIAAALQGTLKGYKDAALTETFGSNIFTLLITLGILIMLSPFSIKGSVFYFDLTWMIIMNLLLVAFIFKGYHYREESLTRFEGLVLLLFYVVLLIIQFLKF